ncbi:MAG: VOC family protein [Anaerolineae bacterium]|nr:VOC family protein [Anaerolineae bacterium]
MSFQLTHLRLAVTQFKACYDFYKDVLGFTPQGRDDSGPYVEFVAGESIILALFDRGMLAQVVHTTQQPACAAAQDSLVLCFEVPDVDAYAARVAAAGITLVNPPLDIAPWSLRVAHFRDPDGNLIEINRNL